MFLIQYTALSALHILGRIKGQNSELVTQTNGTSTLLVEILQFLKRTILMLDILQLVDSTCFAVKSGMH